MSKKKKVDENTKKEVVNKDNNNEKIVEKENKNIKEEKVSEKDKNEKVVNKDDDNNESNKKEIIKSEDIAIDEEKLQKINQEIKANKKKSKNNIIKSKKYVEILRNVVIAIVGIAYIEIMLLGIKRIPAQEFETDLKVFIILSLLLGIIMFEKAFRADRFKLALYGIESIAIGSSTIILLDLFKKQSANMINFFIGVLVVWAIYYTIKCVVIGVKKNDTSKV